MRNRITLFRPDASAPPESETFVIQSGDQLTITSIGLQAGDEITFQLVYVPAVDPDTCACPPRVELPSVAGFSQLRCCGTPIKLTEDNPVVILDNPQRTLLRAIRNVADPTSVWVWAVETETPNLNDRLRGCPCASQG